MNQIIMFMIIIKKKEIVINLINIIAIVVVEMDISLIRVMQLNI